VMSVSLLGYTIVVIAANGRIGGDVTVLCLLLLAPLLFAALRRADSGLGWPERTAAYVTVVLLVYLDQTAPQRSPLLSHYTWLLLSVAALAALARFWLTPGRRFRLTSLDVLVVFIALVVPQLPGDTLHLPPDLSGGILKTVLLLYIAELLLSLELRGRLPRMCVALVLTAIAARGLLALAA
jgi:UDP-GlcNAc:undecaprenyl-phosphate/decaprenyl-phosphate GlcNAc-1-phosphate transferase